MKIDYAKYGFYPVGPTPNDRQREWFERERMVFFHFGMNTFTDKEWGDGTEDPSLFDPTALDVRQWVRIVRDAGFSAAIITAKHHDGFCLWPSKYTEHSVKNSPYKNGEGDIVREFTDACAEFGIKAGIYLSPWDRHEKTWGTEAYSDYYANQLTELMTQYGKIWECWWDGAGSTETVYDWDRWAKIVRDNQPDAIIFGSLGATPHVDIRWVGNERGVAGRPCYANIDENSLVVENTDELNSGKIDGERFIPAEVDVSIRPGWFYHEDQDDKVRSAENLVDLWFSSVGSNAGFLLNIPPDRRGIIHEKDAASILEFNRIMTLGFANNKAKQISVKTSSERTGYEAVNIISKDPARFYSAHNSNHCPRIMLDLGEEKEFNAVTLSEVMDLSHRVTDIEISAYVDGAWQLLVKSGCVGNKLAAGFDKISASRIMIKVGSAIAPPALYNFGLYLLPRAEKNADGDIYAGNGEVENLILKPTCIVEREDNEIKVDFGGMYTFNEIEVLDVGICSYSIHLFNGVSYEKYYEGESIANDIFIHLDEKIKQVSKFKMVINGGKVDENTEIMVFNIDL